MSCFHPLDAWQTEGGSIVFVERGKLLRKLTLPCGQCIGCRLERSRQWAMRCMHESALHESSCFITLTYSEGNVPQYGSLNYSHFQKFMKRLRRRFGAVRFFMCGEYGELYDRPHFHACLFGIRFSDRVLFRSLDSGSRIYTSKVLEELWPFGFSSIGDVTFESAAYVARYCVKKVTGNNASDHYLRVLPDGECVWLEPEFAHMSLKPGIGRGYYDKFKSDMFPRDEVIVNGMKVKPPKYYDKLFRVDGDNIGVANWEFAREMKSLVNPDNNSPERLAVRETVAKARLTFKSRKLE